MASAAVVSVSMGVMKPVLAKLATLMGDEYKKLKGLRKEVTFLQHELGDMDALLEKMDLADELDPQAKKWRKDIIEMSYDIEDRIDDFMQRVGEADDKMGILRKASQYLRTFKDRHRLASRFEEIRNRVMEASERRKRYMLDQCISVCTPVVVDPRLSAIYKESTSLVGIEAQKDELVKWVMHETQELKVMAIVGLGGLGKTTLANEVYHEVGGKFDRKAFVSVSQKPEMIGLLNNLLSQLGLQIYSPACQVQEPINELRAHLQDKRYFIVVDDLWDIRAWHTISCAFPQDSQHSRIVITTRIEGVARACSGNHGYIHLMERLSEADSRKLFFGRIFGSEDDCPSELTKASGEILKKCGGLPLAIITMASMLACLPTRLEGQWEYIQNSLATESATNSYYEDMMFILDLSYKNLPRHLKACFLYLGSYPEDHEINRIDLVRRWVAEGFVSSSNRQDVWDVAESYFNELVNRSMIQPTYNEYIWGVFGYRVHDMLLELIVRRCGEDNFLSLVNNEAHVAAEVQDKAIRRLTIVGFRGAKHDEAATVRNLSRIRSLAMFGVSNSMPPLIEFKFLRVLFLELKGMAIDLTDINQLSQLRYLLVRGYSERIITLPLQIKGLRLLETLDLSGWDTESSIEIVDAPRLSHLIMPMHKRMRLPNWIGTLKLLRTLHGFILPMDSSESIIGLGELPSLSNLQIYSPGYCPPLVEATWMAALGVSLEKLRNLRDLDVTISWSDGKSVSWCADALSSLSPPFYNLEGLALLGLTFSRIPKWIGHLQNLRDLCVRVKQMLQEDVAIIGAQLPTLLTLYLRITDIPTAKIMIGGSVAFPAVKRFQFDCDRMSYLVFKAGAMPQLGELHLSLDVDKWEKAVPDGLQHLPSLEKIHVWSIKPSYCSATEEGVGIRGVFEGVAAALPTRPAFAFEEGVLLIRPMEEEEYLKQQLAERKNASSHDSSSSIQDLASTTRE